MQDQMKRRTRLKERITKILQSETNLIGFGHKDAGYALYNLLQEEDTYVFKRITLNLMSVLMRHPVIAKEIDSYGSFDVSKYLESLTVFFDELDTSKSLMLYMTLVKLDTDELSEEGMTNVEEHCKELEG